MQQLLTQPVTNKINLQHNFNPCLEGCRSCSGAYCCGTTTEGRTIEAPFLTHHDICDIISFTGLTSTDFTDPRINAHTGNTVNFLKTKNNMCLFFDPLNGKCRIHSIRPLDCRLFPLDILGIERDFFWVLYYNKDCHLKTEDINILYRFMDQALFLLGKEAYDYATVPVPAMSKWSYRKIRQIKHIQGGV